MIMAKVRDHFQGACDHDLVAGTIELEKIWPVFSIELPATSRMSDEVGSEYKVFLGLTKELKQ